MQYWLLKSEPTTFSITDLQKQPNKITHWEGVRNYQARNMLRDQMQIGDQAFFYHSNCKSPGIMGVVEIVRSGYPDFTAADPSSHYFDEKNDPLKPRWFMVDIRLETIFKQPILLADLKQHQALEEMLILRQGNRLSVTPVTKKEWDSINKIALTK